MRSLVILLLGPLAGVALVRLRGPLRLLPTVLAALVGQLAVQCTLLSLSVEQRLWLLRWPNRPEIVGYMQFEPTLAERVRGAAMLATVAALVAGVVLLVQHEGRGDDAAPPHDA